MAMAIPEHLAPFWATFLKAAGPAAGARFYEAFSFGDSESLAREVGAEFAAKEGEGDGSLFFWRDAHRQYFTRECDRIGRRFTEDMPVACERFEVSCTGRAAMRAERSSTPWPP